jgi:MoxR-like ATPase
VTAAAPAAGAPTVWQLYRGDSIPRDVTFPAPPPWRAFDGVVDEDRAIDPGEEPMTTFQVTPDLVNAANAALYLRRPLLVTGPAGSGKSSLIKGVAHELRLGRVLRWHVTSSSTLRDALYRYDAIGRLQEFQLSKEVPAVSSYLRLGPLGTAMLPSLRPRALLIDEIDKSDVDLPNDLLDIFENGWFEIPELKRLKEQRVDVPVHEGDQTFPVEGGRVSCREFPFVVLTSNGEREFPAPFLRRCIPFRMSQSTPELLTRIVLAHLGADVTTEPGQDDATSEEVPLAPEVKTLIDTFAEEVGAGQSKAIDQLLNVAFLLTRPTRPGPEETAELKELLLQELETEP